MKQSKTLIVGIGSPHGDDVAGWEVAELLTSELAGANVCVKQATSPLQILDWIDEAERLMLCDACHGFGQLGDINRWTWPASELLDVSWSGTHDFSLTATLHLAERLNRLPFDVLIWSVEATATNPYERMSAEVAAAVPRLAKLIVAELMNPSSIKGATCTNSHL